MSRPGAERARVNLLGYLPASWINSKPMPMMSGIISSLTAIQTILVSVSFGNRAATIEETRILMIIVTKMKLVPQRGWKRFSSRIFATVSSLPCS